MSRFRLYTVPLMFVSEGWLSYESACYLYGEDELSELIVFDFCRIVTTEGKNGVIHVVFYGQYIPQGWLSDTWFDITGSAYVVDVRRAYRLSGGELASYCVNQYTAGQDLFKSFFCSRNWVFPGAWRIYDDLKKKCRDFSHKIPVDVTTKDGTVFQMWVYPLDRPLLKKCWSMTIAKGVSCFDGLVKSGQRFLLNPKGFEEFKLSMMSWDRRCW